jgi:predicted dehydrogenase
MRQKPALFTQQGLVLTTSRQIPDQDDVAIGKRCIYPVDRELDRKVCTICLAAFELVSCCFSGLCTPQFLQYPLEFLPLCRNDEPLTAFARQLCRFTAEHGLCGAVDGDDVTVVGLVDLNEAAAQARADEYCPPGTPVFTDIETALAALKPDWVCDCTIPAAHTPVALTAFKHGCHVLCEKPLSDSLDGARQALAASRKAGKHYAVLQNYRYQEAIRTVRRVIESGVLGRLTTLNVDFSVGAHFGGFRDEMEHVLLLDMAIHTFDMARYLSGADPVSVYCHEWNPSGSWFRHGANAHALFEMTEGMVVNYRGSWCAEGQSTGWNGHWRITGEQGSLHWLGDDTIQVHQVSEKKGFVNPLRELPVERVNLAPHQQGHAGVIDDFVAMLNTGKRAETRAEDNIKSLAMVFAAIKSAETQARVMVEGE